MEYAQPLMAPVLLVYTLLGAIIAVARIKAERGDWVAVHTSPAGATAPRDVALPGQAIHDRLAVLGIPCRLRFGTAGLSSGGTQPVAIASVRRHQAEEAQHVIQELGVNAGGSS